MAQEAPTALYDKDWLASSEFRQRLLVTLGAIFAYRLLAFIPIPGLSPDTMTQFFSGTDTGGSAMARLSVMALGIFPMLATYAWFEIFRLMVPPLRRRLAASQTSRYRAMCIVIAFAIVLAVFQSAEMAGAMEKVSGLVGERGLEFRIGATVALTGGVVIAIALAQVIGRYGLGQGLVAGMAALLAAEFLLRWFPAAMEVFRALFAGRAGRGAVLLAGLYYLLSIAVFVGFAKHRTWIGAAGGRPANPGRFWPPFLASIAGPWLGVLLLLIVRPTSGNIGYGMMIAGTLVFTVLFCWLYELEQQEHSSPAIAGSNVLARTAIAAGAFVVLFVLWRFSMAAIAGRKSDGYVRGGPGRIHISLMASAAGLSWQTGNFMRALISIASLIAGYLIGAFGGGWLISILSPNTHDRAMEAAMSGAFITGPIGAAIGLVAALALTRRTGRSD